MIWSIWFVWFLSFFEPNKQDKPNEQDRLARAAGSPGKLGLAERVGIEPTVPLPGQQFSRLPDSATLAPLRRPKDRVYSHTYPPFCKVHDFARNRAVVNPVVKFSGDSFEGAGLMTGAEMAVPLHEGEIGPAATFLNRAKVCP